MHTIKNSFQSFLLLSLAFLLSGCAHVISKDLREAADPGVTFTEILKNPSAYKGKNILWGGEIIETTNKQDGTTLIEVFQRSLNWREEPAGSSEGRFLVRVESYLDSYVYSKGRKITVAGEILGEDVRPLGEMDYRYPLVLSKQLHLWEYYYPYSYYYPRGYYDPWYPWWGWGYPFGWGFGFGYYQHYHHHHH
jgi:outer membrane lipoprotein